MHDRTLTASNVAATELAPLPLPQLFVAFDGEALDRLPSRHILHGLQQVVLGRGTGGTERRMVDGRLTLLRTLPDRQVSTRHLVLSCVQGVWIAEDAGSKNGSRLNGAPLTRARLADGDVLELGRTVLLFRATAEVDPRNPTDSMAVFPSVPEWSSFHDPLVRIYRRLADVAPKALPVVVLGETGTGKEVVARGLHQLSGLPGALVPVNCAAVSNTLVEAEFFGHTRGAFSGAAGERLGWIRSAERGTLFLDEVGDLPLAAQAALLRALESGEVVPVGSDRAHKVQFRLISATNRDLDAAVEAGTFRADLRARLGTFVVQLPPLRSRPEDLALLVPRLLARLAPGSLTITPGAARQILRHAWPGNARELFHALTQAAALAEEGVISEGGLPLAAPEAPLPSIPEDSVDAARREELVALLRETGGNVAEVGRRLGKHREILYRMFEKYGIDPVLYR